MKLIIKEKNVTRINKVIEWLIYMIGYTLVLILVSSMFKSVYIDKDHFLIYAILIELVLYVLNKTLKPILFTITIPITGITLGLFSTRKHLYCFLCGYPNFHHESYC